MQVESKAVVPTGPEPIFRLYADVSSWQSWDPDTKEATLNGPFEVGTKGRLVPTKGNAVPMEVTSVEPNRSFTVVSRIPLFKMVFEHELRPVLGGTEVTHRVTFSGLLSPVLGRLLAAQLRVGLPRTLQSLSKHAQQKHGAA
jgi:Polyketide cyclase / dehydrase and lipid transport